MPQKYPRTDAHCHLFNIFYLTGEIASILWDKLWGNYPHKIVALGAPGGVNLGEIEQWLEDLIIQINQISHAAFGSYEDNFQLLTRAYQESFNTDEKLVTYPLMMDIYYMFAGPTAAAVGAPAAVAGQLVEVKDPKAEFDRLFGKLKATVVARRMATLPDHIDAMKASGAPPSFTDVEQKLDDIYNQIISNGEQGFKASIEDGLELSKGFEKEVWGLMKLRNAHQDCVFPFFAVDPRRAGIMDVIMKGKHFMQNETPLVSKNGPFFGIKLYPRLGYMPFDVERDCPGLYKWCQENDIPITFHCSLTGFPQFPNWQYEMFGDPANWIPVLDMYPNLKIDFAHFGNNGPGWDQAIINLMKRPGNKIFTDLACYTNPNELKTVKSLLNTNPILKERLMFGTDFDVMLMTSFITLQEYFRQFNPAKDNIFSDDDMEAMSRIVPYVFLNKDQPAGAKETAPAVILPRIDRQSRDTFVKHLEGKNRFGWVRDLPDIRDYSSQYDTLSKRHKEKNVQNTVREMILPSIRKAREAIPPAVDLSHWCSPVEDQGFIGSCTAHAAIALVEYFEIRTQKRHIDASRLFLYKVSRNLLNWRGDTGAYIRTAMEALVLFGVPPEKYMPYAHENLDDEPSAFCYAFGQNFQTASYFRLDPVGTKTDQLLTNIKVSVTAGYPAMFGFTVYDSMGEAKSNKGKVPFPSQQDRAVGGHAVAAVGYDDSVIIQNSEPGSVPTRGAIRIRNSWGPEWGDNGYGWLPYEFVLKGLAVDWWTIIKQEWVNIDNFQ